MPLFAMPKKTAKTVPIPSTDGDSPKPSVEAQRPGTSGTEMLLTTNRLTASAQYLAAQRAETAYKAKKRTAGARQHRTEAKSHFQQAGFHAKEGVKSCWMMVKAVPWMVRDWRAKRQTENEKKAVERAVEKKKKLEEKIAKREGGEEKGEGEEGEAAATGAA